MRGALLSAAALAGPLTASCSSAAEQDQGGNVQGNQQGRAGQSPFERPGGIFAIAGVVDHFSVPPREKDEVLAAFAAHKDEVTACSR